MLKEALKHTSCRRLHAHAACFECVSPARPYLTVGVAVAAASGRHLLLLQRHRGDGPLDLLLYRFLGGALPLANSAPLSQALRVRNPFHTTNDHIRCVRSRASDKRYGGCPSSIFLEHIHVMAASNAPFMQE